jgi:hypothetical protein
MRSEASGAKVVIGASAEAAIAPRRVGSAIRFAASAQVLQADDV